MQATVSLSDYYTKLVQVGLGERVIAALHGEIFHHLNNGAMAMIGFLRGRNKDAAQNVIEITKEVSDEIAPRAMDVVERVQADKKRKPAGKGLLDLLDNPSVVTHDNFQILSTNHDLLCTYASTMVALRTEAEIQMIERSNFLGKPLTMDRACGPATLGEVYNKCAQVQARVKVIGAYRADIIDNMSGCGLSLKSRFRDTSALQTFEETEKDVVRNANDQIFEVTNPMSVDMQDMNVASLRLVTLMSDETAMTDAGYFSLCAFNDRLHTATDKMFRLRMDTEINLLRAGGALGSAFTI